MSSEPTTRKTRSGIMKLKKVPDKPLQSNQPLLSSKLKGKRLETFRKKKAIGTPELVKREYLKSLLESKSKVVAGKCILGDQCGDFKSFLNGPNCSSCFKCKIPIHEKCAIANGVTLKNNFYCCYDCMRDDEMKDAGYSFQFSTIHEDEEFVCYLSKHDKSKDIVSKLLESIMGDKFNPSKDYGVSVVCRGKQLGADDDISGIFTMKFVNIVGLYFSKKNDMTQKSLLKSIEPVRETSQKKIVNLGEKIDQPTKICLVNEHILSYVTDMIAIKSTNPNELEKIMFT